MKKEVDLNEPLYLVKYDSTVVSVHSTHSGARKMVNLLRKDFGKKRVQIGEAYLND